MGPGESVDRLEIERFSVDVPATRGGRGEPVFVNNAWFFGVEYPAAYSRHTDGNTPAAGSGYYDKVGNYSDVQLDGHDIETSSRPGLIRLFHFPGYAFGSGDIVWHVQGKTSVCGLHDPGQTMEVAFRDYLQTVALKPRSFTHYNNWFDGEGKKLTVENWTRIAREFNTNIAPYGIKLDAMVFDDGWQNQQSIWQLGKQFTGGIDDIKKMGEALRAEGTSLGLWLALNGTMSDTKWGEQNGYVRAKANKYFSQYFSYYSLTHPKYHDEMLKQLPALIRAGQLSYMKHDFNHLSDVGEGNWHPATDRHGHEANVDAMIEMILGERAANPDIFLNLTNWMWFSPWWLMYGDALWMLAGDDGFNKNTPDISSRQMATTDRDTYIWRMFGKTDERPLVPISRLMTHGIIKNPGGQMEGPGDTIRDFSDHVMMYYGRGSQMKEWYITPRAMTPDHWKILGHIHRWAQRNFKALCNTVIVGGRPDEGNAYGYIGWDGDHGVLCARNTSIAEKTLTIAFDQTTFFRGAAGRAFRAKVVYPYQDDWPKQFKSGEPMTIEIPAFTTLTLEFDPGSVAAAVLPPHSGDKNVPTPRLPPLVISTNAAVSDVSSGQRIRLPRFVVPTNAAHCDLLVIGYKVVPVVLLTVSNTEELADPVKISTGSPNQFAGYASAGMASERARSWQMESFDLLPFAGSEPRVEFAGGMARSGTVEAWLMVDEKVSTPAPHDEVETPWAIAQNERRYSYCLMAETNIPPPPSRVIRLSDVSGSNHVNLEGEAFGVDGGEFGEKEILLNGRKIGVLPVCGDDWKSFHIKLDEATCATLTTHNEVVIRTNGKADKFKFRDLVLTIARVGTSTVQKKAQTSFSDWVHFEGEVFESRERSRPVALDFK